MKNCETYCNGRQVKAEVLLRAAGRSQEAQALELRIEFASDPKWLSMMRSVVEKWCVFAGFSEEAARPVTLAVDEAITNIIRHAYHNSPGERVVVEFSTDDRAVVFTLQDTGAPVDRSLICKHPPNELRPGGRGTHFIREIMDEVDYETQPCRNLVRLVKYRPAPSGPESGRDQP